MILGFGSLLGGDAFLSVFLIFCRIGGCLLIVPGFSSPRVPAQVRLLIAAGVSLAVTPLLLPLFQGRLPGQAPTETLVWIASESITGLLIGFLGRIFVFVLETVMNAVSTMVGFGSMPGTPVEGTDAIPAVESLIVFTAVALMFAADLHWELFRGLVDSYARIPPGEGFGTQTALVRIADQIGEAFTLALRIAAPFIIYAVAVNLAAGFVNKLTPTIPVYFIATPFVMFGALILLYTLSSEFMTQFLSGYVAWLRKG
ncbi:putative flagellar biosynthetic protein [Methylorubrum populi BJ001]|uniref:Putative flagellar biosynthetic protein n=1 Tax=Methylorubrum populi (strain ATCC BAA-705 / NCIMB 13946 / BJ001) TaxID=441620 RepID=B1ZLA4_METPB|nr:flagellar biosynthesis protein FliR [Methylorubrum populi]ACB78843.1 putative flagellar biosynthetic protein [Methylorubrum populi BJ001]OAH37701.1 flagellar biosynthetic protein FliR [Methylorubrum populi]PZP69405.1 MAG: flagellar biosynthetic protein FliR [Methylorubrum populi]